MHINRSDVKLVFVEMSDRGSRQMSQRQEKEVHGHGACTGHRGLVGSSLHHVPYVKLFPMSAFSGYS